MLLFECRSNTYHQRDLLVLFCYTVKTRGVYWQAPGDTICITIQMPRYDISPYIPIYPNTVL